LAERRHWRIRWYARVNSGTQTNQYILCHTRSTVGSGGSLLQDVQIRNGTGGKVHLRDNFTLAEESAGSFLVGDTWRFELEVNLDAESPDPVMLLRIWYGGNLEGTNPDETLTAAAITGTPLEVVLGPDRDTGLSLTYDSVAVSDGEAIPA